MFLVSVPIVLLLVFPQIPATAFAQSEAQQLLPFEALAIETRAGRFRFTVEIADTAAERQTGLMNRKTMALTHGMLFDFERTRVIEMWMKNTFIPLDMVFIDPDGQVVRVEHNTTPHSLRIISSVRPASHVLELNAGIAKQIGLKAGDSVHHRLFTK